MATGAKTELFVRKQAGGVFTVVNETLTTGNIFFVDNGSSTGSDGVGYGRNPDAPVLTADFANGLTTANNGDRVYFMPGHSENLASAGALTCDTAGVEFIGLGTGPNRAKLIATDAAADINIDAAGVTFRNIELQANIDDVLVCFDVNADDFTADGCHFTGGSATLNFRVCVQDAAANVSDRITVKNCTAIQPDAANTHFINLSAAQDGCIIRDNYLLGDWGTMCIGGAGVVTNIFIHNNIIRNLATTDDACISLPTNSTGMVTRNLCGAEATSGQANHILAADCSCCENYAALASSEDLSGDIEPIRT